jgi:hypothetical protein
MSKFITLVTLDGKPIRVNIDHIMWYRETNHVHTQYQGETPTATIISFVGGDDDNYLTVRERVEEIDRRINPGYAPTTT